MIPQTINTIRSDLKVQQWQVMEWVWNQAILTSWLPFPVQICQCYSPFCFDVFNIFFSRCFLFQLLTLTILQWKAVLESHFSWMNREPKQPEIRVSSLCWHIPESKWGVYGAQNSSFPPPIWITLIVTLL